MPLNRPAHSLHRDPPAEVSPREPKVARVNAGFWAAKALTTALGESTSDWLVHAVTPEVAVALGFVAFAVALVVQIRSSAYSTWRYWSAVAMIGIFGTMAADVAHVGLHVPYAVSTVVFAVVLAALFAGWQRSEHTVSVHDVVTVRRELFYWSVVVTTFALGTALGDLTAVAFGLGYWESALVFATLILVPAFGYRVLRWPGTASFWVAYVLTRPLGASVADWLGKPASAHGVGIGSGRVSVVLAVLLVVLVGGFARTGLDHPARPVRATT